MLLIDFMKRTKRALVIVDDIAMSQRSMTGKIAQNLKDRNTNINLVLT